MTRKLRIPAILIFGAVLLFAPPAHANVMIPVIVAGWFGMFLALVPIILIEWVVLTRVGAHIWESLLAMSVANLASTLAGIPLAFVLDIVVGMSTPLYDESWDPKDTWFREWMLPAGGVLLLIPFFLMSWWIEAPIAAWILDDHPTQFLDSAVRNANLITYGLLAALLCILLALTLRDTHASGYRNRDRAAEFEEDAASVVPWALANDHAKRGMARLSAAEGRIALRVKNRSQGMATQAEDAERDQAA